MFHNITLFVVLHRTLGCSDESSTDEEQGERILYYYPEETNLFMQLSRLSLIEGMIEFAGKFSSEPIDFVMMENSIWAFFECEPNIWMVVAVSNENKFSTTNSKPNGQALQECLIVSLKASLGYMFIHHVNS